MIEYMTYSILILGIYMLTAITGGSSILVQPTLQLLGMNATDALIVNKFIATPTNFISFYCLRTKSVLEIIVSAKYYLYIILFTGIGSIIHLRIEQIFINNLVALFSLIILVIHIKRKKITLKISIKQEVIFDSIIAFLNGFIGIGAAIMWMIFDTNQLSIKDKLSLTKYKCLVSNMVSISIFSACYTYQIEYFHHLAICGLIGTYLGAILIKRMITQYVDKIYSILIYLILPILIIKRVAIYAW